MCGSLAGGWAAAAVRCTFLDANHCPGAVMVRLHFAVL